MNINEFKAGKYEEQYESSLYRNSVTTIKMVTALIQAQTNTAAALIDDFVRLEVLKELTRKRRNRLLIFEDYVRLFKR